MTDCIDIHTHVVPENFPPYAGKGKDVPWPSMAEAHACHRHVMIRGNVYRTVSDGCWSVPRRIEDMDGASVARQALSPMPELLSYWLPLDDAKAMTRFLNDEIARTIGTISEVSSARSTSSALCGRSSGDFSRRRITSAARAGDRSGRRVSTFGGDSVA